MEPSEIQISARTTTVAGPRSPYDSASGLRWIYQGTQQKDMQPPQNLLWPTVADPADFKHANVGWGLVLPERAGQSVADALAAVDAPQCLRDLVAHRAGIVLRCRDHEIYRPGESIPLSPGFATIGRGPGELPRYLLLCGTPREIPWRLQYRLAMRRCVGRLDLAGAALDRYVAAAIADFAASQMDIRNTVLWSVVQGADDITAKMSTTLAEPLRARFDADPSLQGHVTRHAGLADRATLGQSLAARRPSLVVTTSHGMTDVGGNIGATLGLPVDGNGALVDPPALLGTGWSPDGCVWYSHACCSGGCDGTSLFRELVAGWPNIKPVFDALETLGPTSSPLARALLSADRPARAFIGHVEPTFDWTLVGDGAMRLTQDFDKVFYERLFGFKPVGLALAEWYTGGITHLSQSADGIDAYNRGEIVARATMVQERLRGLDRLSMVLYGDPAVSLTRPTGGTP